MHSAWLCRELKILLDTWTLKWLEPGMESQLFRSVCWHHKPPTFTTAQHNTHTHTRSLKVYSIFFFLCLMQGWCQRHAWPSIPYLWGGCDTIQRLTTSLLCVEFTAPIITWSSDRALFFTWQLPNLFSFHPVSSAYHHSSIFFAWLLSNAFSCCCSHS